MYPVGGSGKIHGNRKITLTVTHKSGRSVINVTAGNIFPEVNVVSTIIAICVMGMLLVAGAVALIRYNDPTRHTEPDPDENDFGW